MSVCIESEIQQADELFTHLGFQGYLQGLPPGVSAEAARIDIECAAKMICPGCRRRGMRFYPFHRPGSYVGLVECPHCGAGERA